MIRTTTAIKQIEKMGFKAFHHEGEGSIVKVSAEEGDGAADYWQEFGNDPINPKLERWAEQNGLYWEWENPGCIAAYLV
jgi:hypothetical protein